ncbi:MAG: hypothetical protein DRP18_03630 [Candidatus Aenigmatarchaeota archaeon]|nr:MAG: hypothetical protein DRP18_03630 [Candidatus Aenigmarchaeota archaeon]
MREIVLSDKEAVSEIKAIQSYLRKKGLNATESNIVLACIRLAKRLGSDNWSIYLELKTMLGGETK